MTATQMLEWMRAFERENSGTGWESKPLINTFARGVYAQATKRLGALLGSTTWNDKKAETPGEKLLRTLVTSMSLLQVLEYLQAVEAAFPETQRR